jgi:hypothetical protein
MKAAAIHVDGLDRLRDDVARKRAPSDVLAAGARALRVASLDDTDVAEVAAAPEIVGSDDPAAAVRRVQAMLVPMLRDLGLSEWGAAEAARRITARGVLAEAGVTDLGEVAQVLSVSRSTLLRDEKLVGQMGRPQ